MMAISGITLVTSLHVMQNGRKNMRKYNKKEFFFHKKETLMRKDLMNDPLLLKVK